MNWIDYREKLGIGFNDEQKYRMCKNRVRNITRDLKTYFTESDLETYFTESDVHQYFNIVGESIDENVFFGDGALKCAIDSVCSAKSFLEFISKYVALINSVKEKRSVHESDENGFFSKILEACITGTLDAYRIPYEIYRDQDGCFIFPKGVPEFDRELVSGNFVWLSRYPETEKAWGKALRDYSTGEDPSNVADNFRKALERFFQNFFKSDKTLENLKTEYGKYLKNHGVPGEIAGNLETLIQQYTNYMNNCAKHHDRTEKRVLEYIMYQTGNIMRLLIKLHEEDEDGEENTVC